MKRNSILTLITLVVATLLTTADLSAQKRSPINIVDHIKAGRVHTITLPDSLLKLLDPIDAPIVSPDSDNETDEPKQTTVNGKAVGFRVQVFSDNNVRTAKDAARSRHRAVTAQFPRYRSYISFNSPYWRVRVGDFRTQQEANEAAEELKRAFPSNAKEIRVVRDRISLSN